MLPKGHLHLYSSTEFDNFKEIFHLFLLFYTFVQAAKLYHTKTGTFNKPQTHQFSHTVKIMTESTNTLWSQRDVIAAWAAGSRSRPASVFS